MCKIIIKKKINIAGKYVMVEMLNTHLQNTFDGKMSVWYDMNAFSRVHV